MDQEFITSIEDTERNNQTTREEQKREELDDEDDFYAKMMADLAGDIDTGKKPSVEVPKVK